MDDLQTAVAAAADLAGAHSTAPAQLLQTVAALGRLSHTADVATEGGRRPFRVPPEWSAQLSELAFLIYLLADQTDVDIDASVRSMAEQLRRSAAQEQPSTGSHAEREWF